MKNFHGKKVLVAGRGISGKGAFDALTACGASCKYTDETDICGFGADLIVASPGIDTMQPIFDFSREHGIPLIGEIELGYWLCDKPVIAVTGTNGKTTTVRLIGDMLNNGGIKAAVCGNVGESFATTAVKGGFDCAVAEVSSFQLETVREFRPYIAVITNITADHLDRHGTVREYAKIKCRIAKNQTENDWLVLSQDDISLSALEGFAPASKVVYTTVRGKLTGAYLSDGDIYYMNEKVCGADRVRLAGEHNLKNALCAVCAAKIMNVNNRAIVDALTGFVPDAHRLSLVAHKHGKNFYNDSKGTNTAASLCAARCMAGSTCMIAGGSDKGCEYDDLFKGLPPSVVRMAAVGDTSAKLLSAAERCGFRNIRAFDDFVAAFKWASGGDEQNVLLSPASASFDMFSSYAERGELFERLVNDECEK